MLFGMQFVFLVVFVAVLSFSAYWDWKFRKVPDVYAACLWLLLAFIAYEEINLATYSIMLFALFIIVNSQFEKAVMGWGDILTLPTVLVLGYWLSPFFLLALVLALVANIFNEKIPAVAVIFYPFVCAFLIHLLL